MTYRTQGKISVLLASIIAATCFSACSGKTASESISSSGTVPDTSSVTSETTATTEQTTSEVTESTWITIETEHHENPFLDMDPKDYNNMVIRFRDSCIPCLGFDNPAAIEFLDNEYNKLTGEHNDLLTLSDVGYFQYNKAMTDGFGGSKFCEYIGSDGIPAYEMMFIRAFLIQENLKFGTDEIDWISIANRFPRFQYNWTTGCGDGWSDAETDSIVRKQENQDEFYNVDNPLNFSDPCMYDVMFFMSLINYNSIRLNYMYNNPYGSDAIAQKRDKYTGKNVLEPTEEQARQLMDDIHALPSCENIDIFKVETREEFYASYGIYPEELLDMKYAWSGQFANEDANKYVEEWTEKIETITKW